MGKAANKVSKRTTFYAWQSDSPDRANRYFIREALKKALNVVASAQPGTLLEYDEATRDVAGSILIVDSILAKIDACEVLLADISIINPGEANGRFVPNPNVVFEVGWAAARLGWNRVILAFNEAYGKIESVPFDLRGRATLKYNFDGTPELKRLVEPQVVSDLARRIESALQSPSPVRPKSRGSPAKPVSAQEQRERDRQTLYELLGRLNSGWVDVYLEQLGLERMPQSDETYFLMFADLVDSARFRMFDSKTDKAVREFKDAWSEMIEASRYGDAEVGRNYARFRPQSYANGEKIDELRERFHNARQRFSNSFRTFVDRVHKAFPEFDLSESDARALEFMKAL